MIGASVENDLYSEIADLRAEIERLRAAVREYGKHKGTCNDHGGRDCNCGWEKTRRALAEQEKVG